MSTTVYRDLARQQIAAARDYTLSLLAGLDDTDWFRQPAEGVSHIAWQVGHLAMAEYGLCLFRMRGRTPSDLDLMSGTFRKQYSRGSTPVADPDGNPAPQEIRAVLERVHRQALQEMAEYSERLLDEAGEDPRAVFDTKLGALFFCAHHEMLHAGQIGLLRRLLGKSPIR
jgi:hypothetical protein